MCAIRTVGSNSTNTRSLEETGINMLSRISKASQVTDMRSSSHPIVLKTNSYTPRVIMAEGIDRARWGLRPPRTGPLVPGISIPIGSNQQVRCISVSLPAMELAIVSSAPPEIPLVTSHNTGRRKEYTYLMWICEENCHLSCSRGTAGADP